MFELRVEVDFSAAHHIEGYPGDCARPHGHNYTVEVFARSTRLDSIGLAIDFRKLKSAARELVAPWDHQDLNELPDFRGVSTSAEQIAKMSYERLCSQINSESSDGRVWIEKVTVWETERCSASYFEPNQSA
ncbi:MAG: 6-pyruvoyl trahydropterin synthase family protein [Oligoflexia bacterium]|jgi:6-pyruvoyltetrahydropterin/6-carboxytetrahydropterin synthase